MDPDLWKELEAWAQADLRSVNGQVEYLLKEAVRRRRRSGTGEKSAAADAGPGEKQGGQVS